jgi:rhamnosyltransferase
LNAGQQLAGILEAIKRQTLQPVEVLVLDSESDDNTRTVAQREGARVLIIPRRDFDHGATRNVGLDAVRGDIAVYTVQDAIPFDENWLANLCRPIMIDANVGVVTGRQVPRTDATALEKVTRLFTYPEEGYRRDASDLTRMGLRAAFCTDTNAAYRAVALRDVGKFPAPCIVNEDQAAAIRLLRAGYSLVYEPRAAIVHSHDYGFWQQFQRYFDMGVFFSGKEVAAVGKSTTSALWYLQRHLREVLRRGGPGLVGSWFVDSLARIMGVGLGRNYRALPPSLRSFFSRQKSYWSRSSN